MVFTAQILSLTPGLGCGSPEHLGPWRGLGGGTEAWARRGQIGLWAPQGPGTPGKRGPTCSESEITLFNYTFLNLRVR